MKKFRVDEAFNLYGKIKRVKKVSIYNDITHFQDDYYLFYDEEEGNDIARSGEFTIVEISDMRDTFRYLVL